MLLICPNCSELLYKKGNSAVCKNGHSFDFARQGYVNLLLKQSVDHGDNKEMVQARTAFLNTGSYDFLRQKLKEISEEERPAVLADLGCGEGYYTSVLSAKEKYGFDMSKEALKHASRNDKSTQYVVASIFHLPLETESCDMAVTCFAPFAGEETERILKRNGVFIFISPGKDHLIELKQLLYEHPYQNEIKEPDTSLQLEKEETIHNVFEAAHDDLIHLFHMTPYYHRTRAQDIEKLKTVSRMSITAEFIIRTYRKKA